MAQQTCKPILGSCLLFVRKVQCSVQLLQSKTTGYKFLIAQKKWIHPLHRCKIVFRVALPGISLPLDFSLACVKALFIFSPSPSNYIKRNEI